MKTRSKSLASAPGARVARDPASLDRLLNRKLRQVFGLRELRPGQREVAGRVLAQESTLAIMPTGAGKSLCYQLPAVIFQGLTVVVSPLIALMKDQCEKLCARGVAAVQLNSHCAAAEVQAAEDAITEGAAQVVLTTPERLADPACLELLQRRQIALVVVDEAHCISQWGHDFRPAFLQIEPSLRALGSPTVLALTATASSYVAQEIMTHLKIPAGGCVDTGAYRDNLRYAVEQLEDEAARSRRVLELVAETPGSGIVYAATVKAAEALHRCLQEAGHSAGLYHGRRSASERREAQDAFMRGSLRVIVATNAFGMGIDKPDIRFVLHHQMPAGLDAYYQESGRGGRDGEPALCVLLFLPRDKAVQQFFMAGRYPDVGQLDAVYAALSGCDAPVEWTPSTLAQHLEIPRNKVQVLLQMLCRQKLVEQGRSAAFRLLTAAPDRAALHAMLEAYRAMRDRDRATLEEMVFYAQTGGCRWRVLLAHLEEGESIARCGNCDNCIRVAAQQARLAQPIVLPPQPRAAVDDCARPIGYSFALQQRVKVKRYGVGHVVSADETAVTIEFEGGAQRCFHPDFVRPYRGASTRAPRSGRALLDALHASR